MINYQLAIVKHFSFLKTQPNPTSFPFRKRGDTSSPFGKACLLAGREGGEGFEKY